MENVPEAFRAHIQGLAEARHPSLKTPYRAPALGEDILRAFKGATSRRVRVSGLTTFAWQRSFHDRIVLTNMKMVQEKREYIRQNPAKWKEDDLYTPEDE